MKKLLSLLAVVFTLGLSTLPMDAVHDLARYLEPANCTVVLSVLPDSPLLGAGIVSGDILVAVNGQRLDSEIPSEHSTNTSPGASGTSTSS